MFERLLLTLAALFAKPTVGDPCDDLSGEGSYGDHTHVPSDFPINSEGRK